MKRIIISPTGVRRSFDPLDFIGFSSWLIAVIAGVPKKVTFEVDSDLNETFIVSYSDFSNSDFDFSNLGLPPQNTKNV